MTADDVLVMVSDGARGGRFPLDPIRLMKGAFVVSQRGPNGSRDLFNFRAYDYGPFDKTVYRVRDMLVSDGLLSRDTNGRYDRYELSQSGQERAADIEQEIGADHAAWFRSVGAYVCSKSFSKLLDEIYDEFPAFAVNSLHRR